MPAPPPWSRDETLLALSLAVRREGPVPVEDREVRELSALLRSASPAIAARIARFRNAHGVARKVRQFADRLAGRAGSALCPVDEDVWEYYCSDRQGLAAEVLGVRDRLAACSEPTASPSRGPPPAAFRVERQDDHGSAWLYLAVLHGVVTDSDEIFVKVGRSNDVPRREADLNFALPRRLGLRWRMIASWRTPTAMAAHVAEQAILQSEAAAGRSAGGEFLLIGTGALGLLLRKCRQRAASAAGEESSVGGAAPPSPRGGAGPGQAAIRGRRGQRRNERIGRRSSTRTGRSGRIRLAEGQP